MRSCLILQETDAQNPETLACGAAAVVVDLRPPGAIETALRLLRQAQGLAARPAIYARLAAGQSDHADAALEALLEAPPDGVFLEDAEGGASVQHFGAKLAVFEARANLRDGSIPIVAQAAATAAAAFGLHSYIGCSPRLKALAFGRDELAEALGVDAAAAPVAEARALLVLAAAAAGVLALDAPCAGDKAQLRRECDAARRDGFAGKLATKPGELAIIDAIFRA
jgi:citrate lyase subunit beta / citryl-CoA lyase